MPGTQRSRFILLEVHVLRMVTSHVTDSAAAAAAAAAAMVTARDLLNASSDESAQMMTSAIVAIDKYITPVWYVIGVPGNLLAFVVWTQKKMRASSGCYLAALALNDCIFLLLQVNLSRPCKHSKHDTI